MSLPEEHIRAGTHDIVRVPEASCASMAGPDAVRCAHETQLSEAPSRPGFEVVQHPFGSHLIGPNNRVDMVRTHVQRDQIPASVLTNAHDGGFDHFTAAVSERSWLGGTHSPSLEAGQEVVTGQRHWPIPRMVHRPARIPVKPRTMDRPCEEVCDGLGKHSQIIGARVSERGDVAAPGVIEAASRASARLVAGLRRSVVVCPECRACLRARL